MLEVCPSITSQKPKLEVHLLGIGGKEDPVRLVFDANEGPALNASLIDLGHRFRLVVNEVNTVKPPPMPMLPVARAVWECKPDFKVAAACWIYAGGAHHTGFSYQVTTENLRDFAEIAGIEIVVIDEDTNVDRFRNELRWNEAAFRG
jgi:L-arabinose isomerase